MQELKQQLSDLQFEICKAGKIPSSIKTNDNDVESYLQAIEANEKILRAGEVVKADFGKVCPIDPVEREQCIDCQS